MAILLDNKILEAAEQQQESQIAPQWQSAYQHLVAAGMHIAMQGGPNGLLGKRLLNSKDPITTCAQGALSLMVLMMGHTGNRVPVQAAIPAAATLMFKALDVADGAGFVKVGAPELDKAAHIFANQAFNLFHIPPQRLQNMAVATHGVMQDPAKMELVHRKMGTVQDPRASTPTPVPGNDAMPARRPNRAARRAAKGGR